jgi:hypothetical protein
MGGNDDKMLNWVSTLGILAKRERNAVVNKAKELKQAVFFLLFSAALSLHFI